MKESSVLKEAKNKLFLSLAEYQSLYQKLTKEFCEKKWGNLDSRKEKEEIFFLKIKKALNAEGFSFSELSKRSEEETEKEIKEVISKILDRMATKGNSSHKLQAVFSPLNFQRQFAPGGFSRSPQFEAHSQNFSSLLLKFVRESFLFHPSHVVFSNEAFGEHRYPKDHEIETVILEGSQKENNSASFLKKRESVQVDRVLMGENYFLKVKNNSFVSFTSHFSSIKEEEREEKSDFFCTNRLPELLKKLKSEAGTREFSFAGDVNLYFFRDSKKVRTLRPQVKKLLKEYNLVMIVPSGFVNKNIRPEIHEQWHKLKESFDTEVEAYPDSMVVLEPYDKTFDYKKLTDNGLCAAQDIFFPDGTSFLSFLSYVREPFSEGFIMDHTPVRGRLVSILNGADGDGTGNTSKAFLEMVSSYTPSEEEFAKHLKAMKINVNTTCDFIKSLS